MFVIRHEARPPAGAVDANNTLCCADDAPAVKQSDRERHQTSNSAASTNDVDVFGAKGR
jgi:hypothetical protein